MIRFLKSLLGLTPKTPEQRAFAEFNTIIELMREHYCIEVHQSYQDDIDSFARNHSSVDDEIIHFYTSIMQQHLNETSGLKRSLGF